MHPVFSSARRLGIYILAWQLPAALVSYLLLVSARLSMLEAVAFCGPLCAPFAIVCLSPWYLCRVLPLRSTPALKLGFNHLFAAAVAAFLWMKLAHFLARGLDRWHPGFNARLNPHLPFLFGVGVLLYVLAVALHYTYLELEAARAAIRSEHQARVLAREAELKALKAQINPHFLFNCLNSISALTSIDAAQAREMCVRLSDFLRSTLHLAEQGTISFADEMALARTYFDVEQVRFGSRLSVEQTIDAACERCTVPPLLLQPLVENAVKHGIASLVEGGFIRIRASMVSDLLRVVVENNFDPESPVPRRSGLGLANVRSRIETRHGTRGHMIVTVAGTLHRVELLLPCER
jgi:two-component system sensor histidine kinase AlgZ